MPPSDDGAVAVATGRFSTIVWSGAQVRVTGAQYGKWGREKYGLKPQKLDALEFYPDRLKELWSNIQKEQVRLSADVCLLF